VYAWGNNYEGQAGISSWLAAQYCAIKVGPLEGLGLVAITGGTWHSLAIDKNGSIWGFGSNARGAIGISGITGRLSRWGLLAISPTKLPIEGFFVKVSAGDGFSAALDRDGNAYVWGRNDQGQLGLGHRRDVLTPQKLPGKYSDVSAGTAHILAIQK
jgi:alpha-tubulin suppressor-like RCC1 family protein